MKSDSTYSTSNHNVINLFTGQSMDARAQHSIIQICPETSGIKMIYANHHQPDRLISVPILCWGLRSDGKTVGIVPWVGEITDCTRIDEDFDIRWEGYYLQSTGSIFSEPPEAIIAQLATAMRFSNTENAVIHQSTLCSNTDAPEKTVIQEIPDLIGTHALVLNIEASSGYSCSHHSKKDFKVHRTLVLTPVVSWALDLEGQMHGMLVDEKAVEKTPVVPGDDCLYYALSNPNFFCYFQRDIADQIRLRNPETIAAIEKLLSK
ncbi:MAG TPA: hypothetical protein DCE61_01160 [Cellvibrionales bacterium]|jgi:hypothetical protein|nr:hypothetical protein [Cellvibrionales bacterium]